MQIAKSNFYLHFNFDFLLNYGNFLGSANVLTWWACEMRGNIRGTQFGLFLCTWCCLVECKTQRKRDSLKRTTNYKLKSEHRLKKLYFAPKNCFFSLFSWTAKIKMAFWSNFSPLSYVVIYLVKWRKVASKSHI